MTASPPNLPQPRVYHPLVTTRLRVPRSLRPLVLLLGAFAAAGAQGTPVDAATFRITAGGASAGHETVEITRMAGPDGNALQIRSRRINGGTETRSLILTEGDGRVRQLDLGVVGRDGPGVTVRARTSSGKLSVATVKAGGESLRDYMLSPVTFVADDDLVGPYHAVLLAGARPSVTLVLPRSGAQETMVLRQAGLESIEVGGENATATHWILGDGANRRELWTDAAGRLLRLEVPARGFVAARAELPR